MKIGDASRARRFADPARQRWYAYHRAVRFAMRMWRTTLVAEILVESTLLVRRRGPTER
jgi:hypothetical protein